MSLELDIQRQVESDNLPSDEQFQQWAELALQQSQGQVAIRIVDENESQQLNKIYRHKDKPTNVLSFEMELPDELGLPLQGDLVICAPVVEREAMEQNKALHNHWAHMVIHGMLHLQGYDHLDDQQAEEMESLEITLLQQLGMANPYGTVTDE